MIVRESLYSYVTLIYRFFDSLNDSLTQNLLSDVYTDDLAMFPPDENVIGGRGDKTLKLLSTIENFQFTKNKTAIYVQLQHAAIGKRISHPTLFFSNSPIPFCSFLAPVATTEREKIGLILEVLGSSSSFEERLKTDTSQMKANAYIWNPPEPTPIVCSTPILSLLLL